MLYIILSIVAAVIAVSSTAVAIRSKKSEKSCTSLLSEKDNMIRQLIGEKKHMQEQLESATARLTRLRIEDWQLQADIKAKDERLTALQGECDQATASKAKLETRLSALSKTADELSRKATQMELERRTLLQEKDSIKHKLSHAELTAEQSADVIRGLQADMEKKTRAFNLLQKDLADLMRKEESARQELEVQKRTLEASEVKLSEAEQRIAWQNQQIAMTEADCEMLRLQNEAQLKEHDRLLLLNDELNRRIEEMPDVREVEEELERTIAECQAANEALQRSNTELANLNGLFNDRGELIAKLQSTLADSQSKIDSLIAQVRQLESAESAAKAAAEPIEELAVEAVEEVAAEPVEVPAVEAVEAPVAEPAAEPATDPAAEFAEDPVEEEAVESKVAPAVDDTVRAQTSYGGTMTFHGSHRAVSTGTDDDDLPLIESENGEVRRTIIGVNDLEAPDPEKIIEADEFFRRTPGEISTKSRYLAEADEMNRDAFVCACCGNRVKISKRDYGLREVLFFAHCKKDITCEWQRDYRPSDPTGRPVGTVCEGDINKLKEVKDLLMESLRTDVSKRKGISGVEQDVVVRSKYPFLHWRRAGIRAHYGVRDIVFELQTKNLLLNSVADKDIFYRLNDHHVVWIFGADEEAGYDYLRKHVQQNTLFANRRNVFIVDRESMEASRERHELILKCNYLDPDDKWHYRKETTGSNGLLISVDQLCFDDDLCKPYFFDANEAYFDLHPDAGADYQHSIMNRDDIIKDLKGKYEGRLAEIRKKKPLPPTSANDIHMEETRPEKSLMWHVGGNARFLYSLNGKQGIVDADDCMIIPCEYDEIKPWTGDKYRVRKLDLWGIIDEAQRPLLDRKFRSIGDFISGNSLVDAGSEQYRINQDGLRETDQTIKLPNGWVKYRKGSKWGINDADGNVVVDCQYDEIGSFRGRLIGFINRHYQKLTLHTEYHIPVECECTGKLMNGRSEFAIGGGRATGLAPDKHSVGDKCTGMHIVNVLYDADKILLNDLSKKKRLKKYAKTESDADFQLQMVYKGKISSVSTAKRFFIRFADGRKTYIPKSVILHAKKQLNEFHVGTTVYVKKIGFDSNYDKTLWQLVEVPDAQKA